MTDSDPVADAGILGYVYMRQDEPGLHYFEWARPFYATREQCEREAGDDEYLIVELRVVGQKKDEEEQGL